MNIITMLLKIGILPMALLLSYSNSTAQDAVDIKGRILSTNKSGIDGINVLMISPKDSTILTYAITKEDGSFHLSSLTHLDKIIIKTQALGYKTKSLLISKSMQSLDITLEEEVYELKEMVVRAPKVWGKRDTINYSVRNLIKQGDRTVGDALRHIPGLRLREDGQMNYQGKNVTHLYIEGVDLSQGSHSLITNNVQANDITTIQILDNHQPIRALQETKASDNVAINLKLSPKKKGILSTNAEIGVGHSSDGWLTNSKIVTNYFAQRKQHLFIGYLDNTGNPRNVSRYQVRQSQSNLQNRYPTMANIKRGSLPNISDRYYLDNLSAMISTNSAFILSDSTTLKLAFQYNYDWFKKQSHMISLYDNNSEESYQWDERIKEKDKIHRFLTKLDYERNKQTNYLKSQLSLTLDKADIDGTVLDKALIEQEQTIKQLNIHNYNKYVSTGSKLPIELSSTNNIQLMNEAFRLPSGLTIPPPYSDISLGSFSQKGNIYLLSTNNTIEIPSLPLIDKWQYRPFVTFSFGYNKIDNSLMDHRREITDKSGSGTIGNTLFYKDSYRSLELSLPLVYRRRSVEEKTLSGWLVEPALKVQWDIASSWSINFNSRYSHHEPSTQSLYPYPFIQDYRTIFEGNTTLYRQSNWANNLRLAYHNILAFFSSSLLVGYQVNDSPYIMSMKVSEEGMSIKTLPYRNKRQITSAVWQNSKSFSFWALGVDLDLGYRYTNGENYYQERTQPFKDHQWSVRLNLKASPASPLLIDYELYTLRNHINSQSNDTRRVDYLNQILALSYRFSTNLYWSTSLDHTFIRSEQSKKNIALFDSELSWQKGRWYFSIELKNLMNTTNYINYRNLSYASFYESYQLRPREIFIKTKINF